MDKRAKRNKLRKEKKNAGDSDQEEMDDKPEPIEDPKKNARKDSKEAIPPEDKPENVEPQEEGEDAKEETAAKKSEGSSKYPIKVPRCPSRPPLLPVCKLTQELCEYSSKPKKCLEYYEKVNKELAESLSRRPVANCRSKN